MSFIPTWILKHNDLKVNHKNIINQGTIIFEIIPMPSPLLEIPLDPQQVMSADETAFIRPDNGSVRFFMSASKPTTEHVDKWMVFNEDEQYLLAKMPTNLWLSSGGEDTVRVLVNKSSD